MKNRAPIYGILLFPQNNFYFKEKNMYSAFLMELVFLILKNNLKKKSEQCTGINFFLKVGEFQKFHSQEWTQSVEKEIFVLGLFRMWLARS